MTERMVVGKTEVIWTPVGPTTSLSVPSIRDAGQQRGERLTVGANALERLGPAHDLPY